MGAKEIVYRVLQSCQTRLESLGFKLAKPSNPTGSCGKAWWQEPPNDFNVDTYVDAADRILDVAVADMER